MSNALVNTVKEEAITALRRGKVIVKVGIRTAGIMSIGYLGLMTFSPETIENANLPGSFGIQEVTAPAPQTLLYVEEIEPVDEEGDDEKEVTEYETTPVFNK